MADTGHHRVLRFAEAPGEGQAGAAAHLVLGQPGFASALLSDPPTEASLNAPEAVAVSPDGALVVADTGNDRVMIWDHAMALASGDKAGAVLPPPGARAAQSMQRPSAVVFGPDGALYVADSGNRRVLRWPSLDAARGGAPPFVLDSRAASFSQPVLTDQSVPQGLFVSPHTLYVTDGGNHRVAAVALPLR